MIYIEFLKQYSYFNNSLDRYLLSLLVFIGLLIILKTFKTIIINRFKSLAKKTKNDFDDVLVEIFSKIKPPFYLLVSLYFAVQILSLNLLAERVIKIFFIISVAYEVIRTLERFVDYLVIKYLQKVKEENPEQSQSMIRATSIVAKVTLWLFGITLVLANLGVNVTSVVASLGIGGIAVALAVQNILSDMFSSFSIYLDKPFKVGDFIMIGSDMGVVEKIGLKTTRIRTLQGEELIISNNELTSTRVQNFGRMTKRRVAFDLGVVYETKPDQLALIPKLIEKIIRKISSTDFDRCHFREYGDSALVYEVVFFVNSADYNEYMDIRQKINLDIFEVFAKEKIEFAYPTQKVFVAKS